MRLFGVFVVAAVMCAHGTAVHGVGAVFTVPPQDRTVWANIEWINDKGGCVGWNANYPYPNQRDKWRGDRLLFRVINAKTAAPSSPTADSNGGGEGILADGIAMPGNENVIE